MQKWCPESQITAYAHVAWRWKALSDVLSISPFCCCVSPSPKSTSWRLSKEWLVFQLCVSYGTQTVLATASILLCLFLLIPLKVYQDSAHKDNCFIARTQYSASYPGPASQSWGKRAWYQPTRACANFSQIFWKPYTYGSFTCYTDVSSSNVRLSIRLAKANVNCSGSWLCASEALYPNSRFKAGTVGSHRSYLQR